MDGIKYLWETRYWVHHESSCIFRTYGEKIPTDPWVEEITQEMYFKFKELGYDDFYDEYEEVEAE